MTAFANSHLKVLRQCNAVIISAVRICENLLSQICQEAVSFSVQMSFESILYAFSSAVYMYPVLVWHGIIFVVPPHPGGIFAACGRCRARPSRSWGSGTDSVLCGKGQKVWSDYDVLLPVLICSVAKEYTLRLRNAARPSVYFIHASYGCGALSERSELCGAIANKRMYEIRKRSVFSKRSVYSP